jgi:hypothetical protein
MILILVDHATGCVGKFIFLAFHAYEERQIIGCMRLVRQFEDNVVLNSKLEINIINK